MMRYIETVRVPLEDWVTTSQLEDWIIGVMLWVPLKSASEALSKGVAQVFDDLGVAFIPRNWMHMVAANS